jgi:hypothetical protein
MRAASSALYLVIAALCLLDAVLVTGSLLLVDRAPTSARFWMVSLVVSAGFVAIAALSAGLGRQVRRLAEAGRTLEGTAAVDFGAALRPLVRVLLAAGIFLVAILLVITAAILSRIGEGFAVFG